MARSAGGACSGTRKRAAAGATRRSAARSSRWPGLRASPSSASTRYGCSRCCSQARTPASSAGGGRSARLGAQRGPAPAPAARSCAAARPRPASVRSRVPARQIAQRTGDPARCARDWIVGGAGGVAAASLGAGRRRAGGRSAPSRRRRRRRPAGHAGAHRRARRERSYNRRDPGPERHVVDSAGSLGRARAPGLHRLVDDVLGPARRRAASDDDRATRIRGAARTRLGSAAQCSALRHASMNSGDRRIERLARPRSCRSRCRASCPAAWRCASSSCTRSARPASAAAAGRPPPGRAPPARGRSRR